MAKAAASAATPVAAGVRTTASGAYSDPATVGAMIQKMYPQYASFDPATLGQRWIDVHTPAPASGGSGASTDVLQGPTGTTPVTTTNPNTPDLSGLNKFATPFQQNPQPKPISLTAGLNTLNSPMGGVNTMGQANTPYTVPAQMQQPKQQPALPTSTFDISKVRF